LLAQAVVHDWKLIAATQLNPLIPSSAMGYVFGLSRISFVRYFLFSGIFMLPLSVLFVMTGYSAAYLLTTGKHWKEALALIISVAFAPLVIKLVYRKVCLLFGVKNGS
jgi:uncharacterized membrane protein YdjX (TVP38/TMEM64 family)